MANEVFQTVIQQMHKVMNRVIGVANSSAEVLACSDEEKIGTYCEDGALDLVSSSDIVVRAEYSYKLLEQENNSHYILFAEGTDESAAKCLQILDVTFSNIQQYYDDKYDRNHFVKNVVLDNILPGDIFIKAREFQFDTDVIRVVFLIRTLTKNEISAYEVVQKLFPDKNKDFVFHVNESDIVLIKEVDEHITNLDLEKLARSIVDTVVGEFGVKTIAGIGTTVVGIKDLARSFKEAQVALEVGKVFDTERVILNYNNLGIARLIYQLPTTLCETFLDEVFQQGALESLDQETLFTIHKFFDNSLNVSETSRKLFVHRNTLVYRLEKIKKLTGLDLREFDQAIVFKIALMVKRYLTTKTNKL